MRALKIAVACVLTVPLMVYDIIRAFLECFGAPATAPDEMLAIVVWKWAFS